MTHPQPAIEDERIFLRSLGDITYTQIASAYYGQYHIAITRSTVAGKIKRMNDQLRKQGLQPRITMRKCAEPSMTRNAARKRERRRAAKGIPTMRSAVSTTPMLPHTAELEPLLLLPLWQLADNACRFECGRDSDGVALFCGHMGYPFCAPHKKLVYVKTARQTEAEQRKQLRNYSAWS